MPRHGRRRQRLPDIISTLPDEILSEILENLPLEDAIRTGFLSRRWKDVWKYQTCVEFGPTWVEKTGKEIAPSVDHFISLHLGEKLSFFGVKFNYKPQMSNQVCNWISFALKKNVTNLFLDFDVDDANMRLDADRDPCFELPPSVFQCASMECLSVSLCRINLPDFFDCHKLTVLLLRRLELPNDALQMITSNTPLLRELALTECNRNSDLHVIIAPNPHLDLLVIADGFDYVDPHTVVVINAPDIKTVAFYGFLPREKYWIRNLAQCQEVKLHLESMFSRLMVEADARFRNYEDLLLKLLAYVQHVQFLRLCNWCIQLISVREAQQIGRLSFKCTSMELYTRFMMCEIPGMTYMFKACSNLEKLIILMTDKDTYILRDLYYPMLARFRNIKKFWKDQGRALQGHLQNLKVVEIKDIRRLHESWGLCTFQLPKFFIRRKIGLKLLQILIEAAENLEWLVFYDTHQQHTMDKDDILQIRHDLFLGRSKGPSLFP